MPSTSAAAAQEKDLRQLRIDEIARFRCEHDRQLLVCDLITLLLEDMGEDGAAKTASFILRYLSRDLRLHICDEDDGLYPLLGERCRQDLPNGYLESLSRDHQRLLRLAEAVCPGFVNLASGKMPSIPLDFITRSFDLVEKLSTHLERENAVVIPLAETELTADDLVRLKGSMETRRSAIC